MIRSSYLCIFAVLCFTLSSFAISNAYAVALDIVTAGLGNDQISVLIGNGDGSFGSPTNYDAGTLPYVVKKGDFNNDGMLDVMVSNGVDPGSVAILLGDGNGGFNLVGSFGSGANIGSLTVGDFNQDGHLDTAVSSRDSNADGIAVLFGDGNDSLGSLTYLSAGDGIASNHVNSADVNGDGKLDLVVSSWAGTISTFLGDGSGTFTEKLPKTLGQYGMQTSELGDLTGDGKLDLVTVGNGQQVTVYSGNGDGTFTLMAALASPIYSVSMRLADFNNDGKLDIAAESWSPSPGVWIFINNGNSSFTPSLVSLADVTTSDSMESADFNGDGKSDLAVGGLNVNILLGTGTGAFTNGGSYSANAPGVFSIAVGNFNSLSQTDNTPPEAYSQFDPVSKTVKVFGTDDTDGNLGEIIPVVTSSGNTQTKTYTVQDHTGNKLVLVEKVKKDDKEIKVDVVSLQYNTDPIIKVKDAEKKFEWSQNKDGTIKELEQKMSSGKGKTKQEVEAKYDSKKNQTKIESENPKSKQTLSGMIMLKMSTTHGNLAISH